MPASSTRNRGSLGFFRCPAAKARRDSFHCCCLASANPRRKSSSADWPLGPCDKLAASSHCSESKAFCAAARREVSDGICCANAGEPSASKKKGGLVSRGGHREEH